MLLAQFVRAFTNSSVNDYAKDITGTGNSNSISPLSSMSSTSPGTQTVNVGARAGSTASNFWYMALGRGETAPTYSDYQMADVITELTYVGGSGRAIIDSKIIRTITSSFKNNTESAITVKEIGIGYNSQNGGNCMLMARSILETPVTINPGETYAFTYTISVD